MAFNVAVPANTPWFHTGVNVNGGAHIDIDYVAGVWKISDAVDRVGPKGSSEYTAKPGYALPGYPEGCLVARVGSKVYYIGDHGHIDASEPGELQLSANDDVDGNYGEGFRDNSGYITVSVNVR